MSRKTYSLRVATAIVVVGSMLSVVALARRGDGPTTPSPRPSKVTSKLSLAFANHQHGAARHTLTEIDGSKTPELIPDHYAYRHFLSAMAIADKHTDKQKGFIRQRIGDIGLSPRDAQFFEETLVQLRVRDELDRIQAEELSLAPAAKAKSNPAIARLSTLKVERNDLIDFAKDQLTRGMSSESVAKLQAFIRLNVKTQIRVVRASMSKDN